MTTSPQMKKKTGDPTFTNYDARTPLQNMNTQEDGDFAHTAGIQLLWYASELSKSLSLSENTSNNSIDAFTDDCIMDNTESTS